MAEIYSDLNKDYLTNTKPFVLRDIDCINASIDNILNTVPGSRLFLPEFGSQIHHFLFDPIIEDTAHNLLITITDAIERWEPRVAPLRNRSTVTPYPDENRYEVLITYEVLGFQTTGEFQTSINAQGE